MTLHQLAAHQPALIKRLDQALDHGYLQALGLTPNETIIVRRHSRFSGMLQIEVLSTLYSLRQQEAKLIEVAPL